MAGRTLLVVGLCGLPGAGKTSLAARLAEALEFRLIDRDAIRRAQFPLCAFSDTEKQAATDAALAAMAANCRLGFSSLIDGMTFASRLQRQRFAEAAAREGAVFYPLYLHLPVELARRRVAEQTEHPAGDRDSGLVERIASRFDPPEGEGLRIDATQSPEMMLRNATWAVRLLSGHADRQADAGD